MVRLCRYKKPCEFKHFFRTKHKEYITCVWKGKCNQQKEISISAYELKEMRK